MGPWCCLTLFKIKTVGQSIYTEYLTAKLSSIQIFAYREIAESVLEQPGPGAPLLGSAKPIYYTFSFHGDIYF